MRIGGIYALEGIALDSPMHHPRVIEVLTAFIREHSRAPADGVKPTQWPFPDVQVALAVVGRRKAEHDNRAMDLTRADLTGADLTHANLVGANLVGADLTDAVLLGANFTDADLTRADLVDADLRGARWREGAQVPGHWIRDDKSGRLKLAH